MVSLDMEIPFSSNHHFSNIMTEFSKVVVNCTVDWGKRPAACNGNTECLDQSAKQLGKCVDAAFTDSKKIELESNKVNYILSSVFFLANRLSEATEGLTEFAFLFVMSGAISSC